MNTDSASKRAALAGQWRTPPLPVFPSGYGQPQHHPPPLRPHPPQQSHMTTEPGLQNFQGRPSIPNNSEDYAKALQEAYRKGAEAAAMMAQQQHSINMPTAISCPNFSTGPHAPPQPPTMGMTATSEESSYMHQVHPTPTHAAIPDPLSSAMPPPPPPAAASHPSAHHHHHHPHHHQPPPQPHHQQQLQQHEYSPPTEPAQARSVSLPDMSSYAALAEDEKRQKRLARNRASARLRRLRKKNLVSTFGTGNCPCHERSTF
jgi:hypothetical protein